MVSREYRLVVDGELSDEAGPSFEGMSLSRQAGTTVLIGTVRDQAQLHGLLQRISDLGLTLLSVTAIKTPNRYPGPDGCRQCSPKSSGDLDVLRGNYGRAPSLSWRRGLRVNTAPWQCFHLRPEPHGQCALRLR